MNFEKTFEKLTHTQDPTRIFDEFLDYAIDINLFTLKDQNLKFDGREEACNLLRDGGSARHDDIEVLGTDVGSDLAIDQLIGDAQLPVVEPMAIH